MTEQEFLNNYDITAFDRPSVTTDIVLFTLDRNQTDVRKINIQGLQVLLIKRGNHPFRNKWALPGGFCIPSETSLETARRELQEETGIEADIKDLHLLGIYSDPKRDIRGHTVSAVYVYFSDKEAHAADDAQDTKYFHIDNLPEKIAFDHREILQDAKEKFIK